MTMENMSREMEQLRRANGRLEQENREKDNALQQNKVLVDLVLKLCEDTGRVVPEEALRRLSATQAIATGSSHAVSESANNANDFGHTNEDLHARDVANNQGSDNNGDHASI
ncbi:hypothetical protein SORBI_3004G139400 [Sorghum bicolor]|uniref:Uncharacterized protein n=1 Tax=Sorghum bicolor TaxID=4558 RepID=A0A194YPN3_SORBI|nr:hypothetical protein SORBI_3004G139400 [Sorghum bicolor]OQU84901.1 hypothetical protein SORBI_3004G139400 [Sorghum bicolor]OQU84902.1 hypothetical protein SORBI_3004G139400 [Sorghum bicolor]OQU84903.1 hypothetical protein SORBI_3004G139400 [Sorghum bicolor]